MLLRGCASRRWARRAAAGVPTREHGNHRILVWRRVLAANAGRRPASKARSSAPSAALVWLLCRSKLDLSGWRGQAALPALRHGLWEISAPTLLIKAPIENPSAEPAAHDRRNVASQRSMSPDK